MREVVAASYFGVTGAMSAFTIAFQFPNLIRALFADAALQGAFVPVFTELLEKGKRKEAFHVASSLFFLIFLVLGALTALFMLLAPVIMPLLAPGFDDQPQLQDLTVGLSRVMFPIVLLMALSGVVVGMLNSFGHFSVPALAPLAWNVVIIVALVGLVPVLPGGGRDLRVRDRRPRSARSCSSSCRCPGCEGGAAASRRRSTGATRTSCASSS